MENQPGLSGIATALPMKVSSGRSLTQWLETLLMAFPSRRRRELELRLAEAERQRQSFQDRNFELSREIEWLREQVRRYEENERAAYQTMLNIEYQTRYGYVPFPNAPHVPARLPTAEQASEQPESFTERRRRNAERVRDQILNELGSELAS